MYHIISKYSRLSPATHQSPAKDSVWGLANSGVQLVNSIIGPIRQLHVVNMLREIVSTMADTRYFNQGGMTEDEVFNVTLMMHKHLRDANLNECVALVIINFQNR